MEDMYKAHIRLEIRSTRPYLMAEREQIREDANCTFWNIKEDELL